MKKYQEVKVEERVPKNGYIYFVNYINYRGDFDMGAFEYIYDKWSRLPEGVVISWLEQIYE